jgi:hypothetical protein
MHEVKAQLSAGQAMKEVMMGVGHPLRPNMASSTPPLLSYEPDTP